MKSNFEIAKQIYYESGLKGFYCGVTPRCVSSAILGIASALLYEIVKKF
jgi:hypothetical protein